MLELFLDIAVAALCKINIALYFKAESMSQQEVGQAKKIAIILCKFIKPKFMLLDSPES